MQDKFGLLSAPIPKVLRKMAVPMTFGMVTILTFNLIDTFFVSQLGTDALAAISYTFPITFGINCITMGIGVGLSTHIGRYMGQNNDHQAHRFASHGLLLTLLLISLVSFLCILLMPGVVTLLPIDKNLSSLIEQYMIVWFLSVPLLAVSMSGSSIIRASGNTKTPAIIMCISGLMNVCLDPLFIFGFGIIPAMGIQGAALASTCSWMSALGCTGYVLIKRPQHLAKPVMSAIVGDWKRILHIGTPAALSNAMTPLSTAIFMGLLTAYGKEAIAAYGAAQRLEAVLMIVLMALTSSLTPFMSHNFGAENQHRSYSAMFLCMRFSILFQLLIFIMLVPLSMPLATLFSDTPDVQHLLWNYLLIVPISYGFQGVIMLLSSSLNSLHHPGAAFLWNFARLFIFNIPFALLGSLFWGLQGVFGGIAVGNGICGILGYMHALKLRKAALCE